MEVKVSLSWVIQPVLYGVLDEVCRGLIVLGSLRVVLSYATLVPRDEVLILGHTAGEPAVSRGGL